jgi:hypothetical protein
MGKVYLPVVAWHRPGSQGEILALPQGNLSGDLPHPQLGSLKVAHDGQHPLLFLGQATHQGDVAGMDLMVAVGEIDAGHIHSGPDHLPQGPLRLGSRTQGADDFGTAHPISP